MEAPRVLLIEDDTIFAKFVVKQLEKQGFDARTVATAAAMFDEINNRQFDCFIVDLTLPDEDGIVLIRKLRMRSDAPIVVLTGRDGISDKMASFELGADDYVIKPVDPRELVMRLNSVLKRSEGADRGNEDILHFGDFALYRSRNQAHGAGGQEIDFTQTEFALLWALAQADGNIISRDTIVDAVYSGDGPETFRAVDIIVSRIRKKLGKDCIVSVYQAGYKSGWPVAHAS